MTPGVKYSNNVTIILAFSPFNSSSHLHLLHFSLVVMNPRVKLSQIKIDTFKRDSQESLCFVEQKTFDNIVKSIII